jgi:putative membrane protein
VRALADDPDEPTAPLARFRTDLSEDRTVLANERTFASWVRTGFAGIGIGIAFNALFTRIRPEWVPKAIATVFLLIAIMIFIAAERRACAVLHRLHAHEVKTIQVTHLRLIMVAAVVATISLLGVIWLLQLSPLY